MKVVILCGGKGSRMKAITDHTPKPLAMIGGKPILWHIMKTYMNYGFDDFILLLGYKGEKIKEYFMDYTWKNNNFILDTRQEDKIKLLEKPERWRITFVDTGMDTMTGGRIKKAQEYIGNETFMLTYGDGLANINLLELLEFHKNKGRIATVTGIRKNSQYGIMRVENNIAKSFQEKKQIEGIINGGFFVFNKEFFEYLDDDPNCILEQGPLMNLVKDNQLAVYSHREFWMSVDNYKELLLANDIWEKNMVHES